MYFCIQNINLKFKHYILLFCLFTVLTSKTIETIYSLFSESAIELSQEFDEEDTPDEEDNEKETSEKDMFIHFINLNQLKDYTLLNNKKNNFYYHFKIYRTPILDAVFCPPDLLI